MSQVIKRQKNQNRRRDINFFSRVIFIVDIVNGLEIDKKCAIKPVSALSSIFGTFVRTHPINLKLYQNIKDINLTKNHEKKLPIFLAFSPKWPFENSKFAKISKITTISKFSKRHENFFCWVLFIMDFEYELRIDKNYEILPISAIPATFGTFAKTYPITLKLYQNMKHVIFNKNHGKKLAIFMVI